MHAPSFNQLFIATSITLFFVLCLSLISSVISKIAFFLGYYNTVEIEGVFFSSILLFISIYYLSNEKSIISSLELYEKNTFFKSSFNTIVMLNAVSLLSVLNIEYGAMINTLNNPLLRYAESFYTKLVWADFKILKYPENNFFDAFSNIRYWIWSGLISVSAVFCMIITKNKNEELLTENSNLLILKTKKIMSKLIKFIVVLCIFMNFLSISRYYFTSSTYEISNFFNYYSYIFKLNIFFVSVLYFLFSYDNLDSMNEEKNNNTLLLIKYSFLLQIIISLQNIIYISIIQSFVLQLIFVLLLVEFRNRMTFKKPTVVFNFIMLMFLVIEITFIFYYHDYAVSKEIINNTIQIFIALCLFVYKDFIYENGKRLLKIKNNIIKKQNDKKINKKIQNSKKS